MTHLLWLSDEKPNGRPMATLAAAPASVASPVRQLFTAGFRRLVVLVAGRETRLLWPLKPRWLTRGAGG